ncbi:hypothetical protein CSC64_10725 [Pseudoxanthomonas koreensis]|nr:hypothetical protein CSC64_10725 [Pseudoxanthomonas koreensis]
MLNRGNDNRPGFTGHVMDAGTGLTYMQERYMDPRLGVFLSVDPVTAYSDPVRMFNRYAYAFNNPYKFTDPDGRAPQDNWYGYNDQNFRDWVHDEKQLEGRRGAQNYTRAELDELNREWKAQGEPRGKGGKSGRGGSNRRQRGFALPSMLKFNLASITWAIMLYIPEAGSEEEDIRMREYHNSRATVTVGEIEPVLPEQEKPEPPKPPEPPEPPREEK